MLTQGAGMGTPSLSQAERGCCPSVWQSRDLWPIPKGCGSCSWAGLGALGFLEPALPFLSQGDNGTPVTSVPLCLLGDCPRQRDLYLMSTGLFSPDHFPRADTR